MSQGTVCNASKKVDTVPTQNGFKKQGDRHIVS